jgi:hypothetical protein
VTRLTLLEVGACSGRPIAVRLLSTFLGRNERVGFFEQPHVLLNVVALFDKGLRIPLAACRTKKVATLDVNRARQTRNGIGHRVDNITSKRFRVLLA